MSRIVPWMCREEWLTTYHNLYNFQEPMLQLKGIQRVQSWKSRGSGKIPLSVEATASLIAATALDVEQSPTSPLTVRLTMTMAVVRFVNGMVDMEQKGVYARSVQSIADDIGLPDWLVDLRHEGTHAGLPSLEVLRTGCQFSLDWLRERYWEAQMAEIQERDEKLLKLIQSFIEEYEIDLSKSEKKKKRKRKNHGIIKEIVNLTCEYNMWNAVLDLLTEKLIINKFSGYWPDIVEKSAETVSMDLPKEALGLWGPLLKALNKANGTFLTKLVKNLVQRVYEMENNSEDVLLIRYISCWVYFILVTSSKESEKKWEIVLDYSAILEVSLQCCSSYTMCFVHSILGNFKNLPNAVKEKLKKLVVIALDTAHCVTSLEDQEVSTTTRRSSVYEKLATNFPHLADHIKSRMEQPTELKATCWQVVNPAFARAVPLGALVGCKPMQFEKLELLEELDSMEVETSAIQGGSFEPTKELHAISDNSNFESEESSGLQSRSTKGLDESTFENISKQLWLF